MTLRLPLLLLVSLLLCSIGLAQNPKQELNDQLFEATRAGDAAEPAISDGLLIVRGLNHVFAFGEAAAAKAKAGN